MIPVKSNQETTLAGESESEESLPLGDREIISIWRSVKGFKMPLSAALELVAKLRTEFSDVDILAESKAWAARKLSDPLTNKSRLSGQLWNFMAQRHKWNQEKKGDRTDVRFGANQRHSREIPKHYTTPEESRRLA
jgi:hypothetical protein